MIKTLRELFDWIMETADEEGHIEEIVKLCKDWNVTDFNDEALVHATEGGHVEIVKLCKEWGATNFESTMEIAALRDNVEIVKLCKEWGATYLDWAMVISAYNGYAEI